MLPGVKAVRISMMLHSRRASVRSGRAVSAEHLQDDDAGDRKPQKALKKQGHRRIVRDGDETAARGRWSKKISGPMSRAT